MKKVLLVGANSFLGHEISEAAKHRSHLKIFRTGRNVNSSDFQLDLGKIEEGVSPLVEAAPDVILWIAANKDVKWCEANPIEARQINCESLVQTDVAFQNAGLRPRFIFISSDYVFDGLKGQYRIEDATSPTTVYGRLKVKAEDYLDKKQGTDVIVRTSALLGERSVFLRWLVSELKKDQEMRLFENSYFTPTGVHYLSQVILDLIDDENVRGITHVCGDRRYSRFALAEMIQHEFSSTFPAKVMAEKNPNYDKHDLSLISSYAGSQPIHSYQDIFKEVRKCINL